MGKREAKASAIGSRRRRAALAPLAAAIGLLCRAPVPAGPRHVATALAIETAPSPSATPLMATSPAPSATDAASTPKEAPKQSVEPQPAATAADGTPPHRGGKRARRAELRETLLELPAYRALKESAPGRFKQLLDAVMPSLRGDESEVEVLALARTQLGPIVRLDLARAPDAPVVMATKLTVTQVLLLAERGDPACFSFLAADPPAARAAARSIHDDLRTSEQEELARVITGAATHPEPTPGRDAVAPRLDLILPYVRARFGNDATILEHLSDPGVDKLQACRVMVALYQRVLVLPRADAARVLRFLYSQDGVLPR